MARTFRSAKDLWSLVTGSSVLNCKELIQYEIERNSDHIVNGVLHFKKSNDASLDGLKKSVDDPHFEFLSKLSKLINVDAMQSKELFLAYASYEFKGTQKTLEAHLINERLAQALLHEMWHYYYSERLYYMLILKHILNHWQDDTDPYKEIYESFLEKYNKDNAVISKVLKQIENSINSELPTKESHGIYMTDLLSYHWVTYTLKEQGELLQLLLLYYKVVEHNVEDAEKMFALFQSHGFGLRQSFRMVKSDDTKHLVDSIGYLESFVLIQCFELEFLFKCKERGMIADHYLLKNEKALMNLTESILPCLGCHQAHSPILMAWLLIAHSSANPDLIAHCNKLGKLALQLNVFDYLTSALTTNVFSTTGIISEISNNIVYNLLSAILSLFELQYLGPITPLFTIAKETLKHPLVANDFWKKGEDSGIRELFNSYAEMFPLEFCPVLELCASLSLANKESCLKVVELLKCIPVYAEYLENVDGRDIAVTQEQNVLKLTSNRVLYRDNNLVIPKETYGLVTKDKGKEGSSVIQWKVLLNGWQICLREIFTLLQEISFSSVSLSSESIMKMTAVAKLVDNILKMDIQLSYNFTHLINILFSFLQRCINTPFTPLEFISICINIAASLSKDEISDVWQQLSQIRLLPFLSHTPKNTLDLIGSCMNVSILGQFIASKECVSGEYSVCLSFLNLISNISQTLAKEDETFIACITYILREIFSSFHKWYFSNSQQRILMGQKCLNLLHNLLSVDDKRSIEIEKSRDLAIFALLNLEAGQTLLKIVCTGEEVIQQTILKQNSNSGDQIATMIRLSLSVLNRLLQMRNKSSFNSKTEVSPLVSVLFSTPGHTNQPQVVLMVAHYVFQRYNPRLATLAVQLLKRFAKEFPMSLLGCFSSEAEAIRDHFLARLSSQFEDIRLKVSILEFLTVCVAQQPGLIEMFINIRSKEKSSKTEETKSCLDCVKNILQVKMNEPSDFPPDLLCAAVEFIHALWAGHQALAMEALKEDQQFWNLTCNSILNSESLLDAPGINAYIIRTLALEIFYSGRNNLHQLVQNVLKIIQEKKLLLKWAENIHCHPNSDAAEETSMELDLFAPPSSLDSFSLLTAWRDFLLVTVVYEPVLFTSDSKKQILKNILEQFTSELTESNQQILILLSELFLMLSRHWQKDYVAFVKEEDFNPIYKIISEVASNIDTIHLREQLVVISLAVFTIRIFSKHNEKINNIKEWVNPCCQLLKTSSQLIHRSVDPKDLEGFLKLPTVIIILLNELVQKVKDWLPILKSHSILPLLVSLLIKCLKFKVGIELSHAIIVLFLSMSSDKKAAETLCNSGFMSEMILILSNIDFETQISERRKGTVSQKQKLSQIDVYYAFLRFITVLLKTLGNYFLPDCWNFIGVHQDLMHLSLHKGKTSFRLEDIQEAIFTSNFILQLSSHRLAWKLEHPKSLNVLLVDVCNCVYGTIAILSKPELLKYYIMKKIPDSKLTSLNDIETENLLKRGSSEDESQIPAEVSEIQEKLYELLAVTLTILNKFSPELYETLSGNPYDYAQWQLFLSINFSVPSMDRDGPLGFGSLLACISMCLKQFVKNEKTPSPRKTVETPSQMHRPVIMYILEVSLALLISQANIAIFHPDLHLRDKQIIKRELAPELNSMNITMNRYLRRGPPSPVPMATTPSPMKSQSMIEHPFLRLIGNLIEKLFK